MESSTFTYKDQDGVEIFVYKWSPGSPPKAAVQIAHGLAEHAARYEEFAEFLTGAGYVCYADDHRGHGKTAGDGKNLGRLGPGGWDSTVKALKALTDIIKKDNPGIPLFMIGHSWGSLLAQDYIEQWGSEIKGIILSGTNGKQPFIVRTMAPFIANRQMKKLGPDAPSDLLSKLAFKGYNKPYEPAPTEFEWLCTDRDVVDRYVNDPYCGWMSSAGTSMYVELAKGVKKIARKSLQEKIPTDLPIYIMTGSEDPTNNQGKGARVLYEQYRKLSIKDLKIKSYQGARHEILNETNREEVYQDMLDWMESHA